MKLTRQEVIPGREGKLSILKTNIMTIIIYENQTRIYTIIQYEHGLQHAGNHEV